MIKLILLTVFIISLNNISFANESMSDECKALVAKYKNYRGKCTKNLNSKKLSIPSLSGKSFKIPKFLGEPAPPSKLGNYLKNRRNKKK